MDKNGSRLARQVLAASATTLMIRNVPTNVSQCQLIEEIDASGFCELYDFVYLPFDFDSKRNKGFAFVNMSSPDVAARFVKLWKPLI